jgi:hypothetical protein
MRIANSRRLRQYLENVVQDPERFQAAYDDYVSCWDLLKESIHIDIRRRIDDFLHTRSDTRSDDLYVAQDPLRTGYLQGYDARTVKVMSYILALRLADYRLEHVSQKLRANMFYSTADRQLIDEITHFLYESIVFPSPAGIEVSFHNTTSVQELPRRVVNTAEFSDAVPLVPFMYYGASRRVMPTTVYEFGVTFRVRAPQTSLVPVDVNDVLYDYDMVSQADFASDPELQETIEAFTTRT